MYIFGIIIDLQPKEELFFVIKYNKKERKLEKLVFSLLKIPLHECEDTSMIRMKYFFICYSIAVYSKIERIYAGPQCFLIPTTL